MEKIQQKLENLRGGSGENEVIYMTTEHKGWQKQHLSSDVDSLKLMQFEQVSSN